MNRIDRLFAILLVLQRERRLQAVDLAARFNISKRTIYRDMRSLNEMGVPIISLPGEGYELPETFKLPPIMLTPEEATALFLAGRMLTRIGKGDIAVHAEMALAKITSVLPTDTRKPVHQLATLIDFFPTAYRFNWDEPHLLSVIDAIAARHVLRLTYRCYKEAETTEREVEPHQVSFADGAWYVSGYCRLRHDIRNFRLNRITDLTSTGETFEKRLIVPERIEKMTVRVRFRDIVRTHVRERQHYAFAREENDTMVYEVHTLDEVRNWLFGFGADAEVLSPTALRHWIRDEAKKLINLLT